MDSKRGHGVGRDAVDEARGGVNELHEEHEPVDEEYELVDEEPEPVDEEPEPVDEEHESVDQEPEPEPVDEEPDSVEEEHDPAYEGDLIPIEDEDMLSETDRRLLEEDIRAYQRVRTHSDITMHRNGILLVIIVALEGLSQLAREASGLIGPKLLTIELHFRQGYNPACPNSHPPLITVNHGRETRTTRNRRKPTFVMGLILVRAIELYLESRWKARGENFLNDLVILIRDRVYNAGNRCMMCDKVLPYPDLKPTVCDSNLCVYQLEQVGLGANLALFDIDPQVANLLITALKAPHHPGLAPIELPYRPDGERHYNHNTVSKLLDKVPWSPIEGDWERALREADPDLPRLVAWVFATNRAHIRSIPLEEQTPEMNTTLQFYIHTTTRRHARDFEHFMQGRESVFGFHGSPMTNWHNILRQNLRNFSGTEYMSRGAVYGNGVYLGTDTGYALNHCGHVPPYCFALVEAPKREEVVQPDTDLILVRNEACAMLRRIYLYYDLYSIPTNIKASQLVFTFGSNGTASANDMLPGPDILATTQAMAAVDVQEKGSGSSTQASTTGENQPSAAEGNQPSTSAALFRDEGEGSGSSANPTVENQTSTEGPVTAMATQTSSSGATETSAAGTVHDNGETDWVLVEEENIGGGILANTAGATEPGTAGVTEASTVGAVHSDGESATANPKVSTQDKSDTETAPG